MSVLNNIFTRNTTAPIGVLITGSTDVHAVKIQKGNGGKFKATCLQSFQNHGTGSKENVAEKVKALFDCFRDSGIDSVVVCNSAGHLPKKITFDATEQNGKVETKSLQDVIIAAVRSPSPVIEECKTSNGDQRLIEIGLNYIQEPLEKATTKRGKEYLAQLNDQAHQFKYQGEQKGGSRDVCIEVRNSKAPVEGPSWAVEELTQLVAANASRANCIKKIKNVIGIAIRITAVIAAISFFIFTSPFIALGGIASVAVLGIAFFVTRFFEKNPSVVHVFDCGGKSATRYYQTSNKTKGITKHKTLDTNKFLLNNNQQGWIKAVVSEVASVGKKDEVKLFFTGKLRNDNRQDWIKALNTEFKKQKLNATAELKPFEEEGKGHAAVMERMLNVAALVESRKTK